MSFLSHIKPQFALAPLLFAISLAHAGDRLVGTGGVTQIKGSGGGSLMP
jgi:hypothetical protein